MQQPIIKCEGLGKCYRIYNDPKDRLKQVLWKKRRQYFKEYWALRDINIELETGESLGIIGRNGCGKSTLLQMICGTVTPTEGVVETRGRIAALLELGSGFNPEFTGIENVYLNATLLGLSQKEIRETIDEIISFSEIEDFANQPVKIYSSGMMLRLAFSVIAHSRPEILIVDEALAVGDNAFQQKCTRKIRDLQNKGVNLLLVSHDENAIKRFCTKCIYLDKGRTVFQGSTKESFEYYMRGLREKIQKEDMHDIHELNSISKQVAEYSEDLKAESTWMIVKNKEIQRDIGDGSVIIEDIEYMKEDKNTNSVNKVTSEREIDLRLIVKAKSKIKNPTAAYMIKDKNGLVVFSIETDAFYKSEKALPTLDAGNIYEIRLSFKFPILKNGVYSVDVAIANGKGNNHTQCFWCYDTHELHSETTTLCNGITGSDALKVSLKKFPSKL